MKPGLYYLAFVFILLACYKKQGEKEQNQPYDSASQVRVCYSPKTTDIDWYNSGQKAPRLDGLKGIDFRISTSNPEVQAYFNQGMMLAYGFNHAEAARSFHEAIRMDSTCAMAYWGFAYVLGPNYNAGMEEDNFQRAWEAGKKAQKLSAGCTPKEKALISALASRYAKEPPANRTSLDIAYAKEMEKVYTQFSSDPDIGALYAEAMMNLHPWDLYEKKAKTPKPWTPRLVTVLNQLLKKNPRHPGAHHLYIHALEASATPEKALASAGLLDSLVPGAGHLLHMPSHIYINTGDYHEGSLSNIRAVKADSGYITACHAQGAYPLAYFPHNYHFLAATATLEGNSDLAWMAAQKIQQYTAKEVMRMPGWGTLQHYFTIPYYIAVKFSMWDDILSLPYPGNDLIYPRAIWHYARGMAFLGKRNIANAEKELGMLNSLATDPSLKEITVWNINTISDLVQIASKVLTAGLAAQQNQLDKSAALLGEAIAMEDNLNYNEPPDWFFSVRHHLGAVLLKAGKSAEAERVYRQDLKTWKKNGWALIGLYNALVQQKNVSEAQVVKSAFDRSWQYANVKIKKSSDIAD
jgi:tetratricopeptide (TPR) repeat protein